MHYPVVRRTPHTRISQIKDAEKKKEKTAGSLVRSVKPVILPPPLIGHARLGILGIFALRSCLVSASSD